METWSPCFWLFVRLQVHPCMVTVEKTTRRDGTRALHTRIINATEQACDTRTGGVSSSSCGVVRGASGNGFSREIPAGNFGSIQTRRRLYARRRHCRCLFRRIDVHFVTLFEKFERFAILDGIDKIFKLFQQVRDEVPHVFASHEIDEL